jgi:hypothetical protein
LGTTSDGASIDRVDTDSFGYAARDVLRFSYAGGRTPAGSPAPPLSDLQARPYDAEDSQQDLTVVADRLLDLLGQIAAREPGVPIDVLAHSQGGVVVQWALVAGGGRSVPESVDLVVTLGSPHDGTDLATGAAALNALPRGRAGLSWIGERLDLGLRPDAASIQQLSETSELMAILDGAAVPASVRVLTIGARGDLIVPAGHTRLPGAAHHVVDLTGRDAHTRLPGDDATTREIGLGLAGMAPTCEGAWDTLGDLVLSEGISWSEDALALSALTFTGP